LGAEGAREAGERQGWRESLGLGERGFGPQARL